MEYMTLRHMLLWRSNRVKSRSVMAFFRKPQPLRFTPTFPVEMHFHDHDETWIMMGGKGIATIIERNGKKTEFEVEEGDILRRQPDATGALADQVQWHHSVSVAGATLGSAIRNGLDSRWYIL